MFNIYIFWVSTKGQHCLSLPLTIVLWADEIYYNTDSLCLSSQITDQEAFLEAEDGHVSGLNSAPNAQNVNSDSGISFAASGEIRIDGGKDDSKTSPSPSYCDNKSSYSSMVGLH